MNTTTIKRDRDGKLGAKTVIDLGFDRRELHIETHKNIYRGGVSTRASVVQISEDGMSHTHVFGLAGGSDWSKTLADDASARGTEKTITAQHTTALLGLNAVITAAIAHYGEAQAASDPLDDFNYVGSRHHY